MRGAGGGRAGQALPLGSLGVLALACAYATVVLGIAVVLLAPSSLQLGLPLGAWAPRGRPGARVDATSASWLAHQHADAWCVESSDDGSRVGALELGCVDAVLFWANTSLADYAAERARAQVRWRTLGRACDFTRDPIERDPSGRLLAASVASLAAYAPWLRRVIVIVPSAEHTPWQLEAAATATAAARVRVVALDAVMPAAEQAREHGLHHEPPLPVHTRNAMAAQLHRLPGLAPLALVLAPGTVLTAPVARRSLFTTQWAAPDERRGSDTAPTVTAAMGAPNEPPVRSRSAARAAPLLPSSPSQPPQPAEREPAAVVRFIDPSQPMPAAGRERGGAETGVGENIERRAVRHAHSEAARVLAPSHASTQARLAAFARFLPGVGESPRFLSPVAHAPMLTAREVWTELAVLSPLGAAARAASLDRFLCADSLHVAAAYDGFAMRAPAGEWPVAPEQVLAWLVDSAIGEWLLARADNAAAAAASLATQGDDAAALERVCEAAMRQPLDARDRAVVRAYLLATVGATTAAAKAAAAVVADPRVARRGDLASDARVGPLLARAWADWRAQVMRTVPHGNAQTELVSTAGLVDAHAVTGAIAGARARGHTVVVALPERADGIYAFEAAKVEAALAAVAKSAPAGVPHP